ncbi:MAG: sodium:calcium antiporter [Pseudomonadota bacterium]
MPETSLIVSLIGGLIVLAFAGDFLVTGAVSLARRIGMSPLVAGIFIVGFGTSAPEMIVALDAARSDYPNLALGNIVGSNIANVLLVLAIPALIAPVQAGGWGQRPALIVMVLATAGWITLLTTTGLTVSGGTVFVLALAIYASFTLIAARAATNAGQDIGIDTDPHTIGLARALGSTLVGIVGLPIGAHLIVEGGVGIARFYAVPEELIGLSLLAIGTSLPEIGAGIASALRSKTDVLVGNVLGSNIFNILGAGGLVAFFGPIQAAASFNLYDHWIMVGTALILGGFILTRSRIGRLAGSALLLIYAIYIYGLVEGWNIMAMVNG